MGRCFKIYAFHNSLGRQSPRRDMYVRIYVPICVHKYLFMQAYEMALRAGVPQAIGSLSKILNADRSVKSLGIKNVSYGQFAKNPNFMDHLGFE